MNHVELEAIRRLLSTTHYRRLAARVLREQGCAVVEPEDGPGCPRCERLQADLDEAMALLARHQAEPSPALREAAQGLVAWLDDRWLQRLLPPHYVSGFDENLNALRAALAAPAKPAPALREAVSVLQAVAECTTYPNGLVYDTAHPDPNQRLTPYEYESTADSVDITGTGRAGGGEAE